jgi:hypothetical protein
MSTMTANLTWAQEDSLMTPPKEMHQQKEQKVFYGGTLGFSFGDYFRISVQPMVGYNFTDKISGGVKVAYEYISDSRANTTYTWHNFGGSVFGRYRFVPQAYLHSEFAYMSYDGLVERQGVPFILLGGGYVQRISPNTGLFVEVLFDVLQDSNSPYEEWAPFVSVGVAVGI